MKRIAKFSFFYSILGLLLGAFYREFTKMNGFKGRTVLSGLHTHVLVLGTLFLLVVLLLEKSFGLTKNKNFNKFFIIYNIGLLLTVIMMAVRGCTEVLRLAISTTIDSSISGIAGLGHIVMTIAYVLFFLMLLNRINDVDNK
jgi:heme/copper-type cytochrome/quinol oxidase subunit 1